MGVVFLKKILNSNRDIIVDIILSFILTELLFLLFNIKNDVILPVFTTAIIYYSINSYRKNKREKRESIIISIFSVLLSIVFTLENKVSFSRNVHSNFLENSFDDFSFADIFRFILLFSILFIVFNGLYYLFKITKFSITDTNGKISKNEKVFFWIKSSLLFFIPFFIFLIINYPGFITQDSLASIYQGINRIPLTNHHPVLYTELIGFIMHVGYFFHSYNFGLFLCSVFQLTVISMVLGYFLMWLKTHNVKFIFIIFTYLFYVSNTLFANYAITMWKDPLFSCFLLFLILYLYDIVRSNGELLKTDRGIAKFILLVLFVAFLRNNGIYIIIGLFVVLLFYYRKELMKFHISYLITIIAIILIQGPLYNKLGIISPTVESFAIPLQQVARTISFNGNISSENLEFLNKVLPIEKWKEKYEPMSVDSIKWDEEFNADYLADNKIKFLKIWGEVLHNNLDSYVKAYLLETYGFWSIGEQIDYGLAGSSIVKNDLNLKHIKIIDNIFGIDIAKYIPSPFFIGSGTMLWIMILSCTMLMLLKKSKYIISLLPCLLSVLTILIATPVAFSLRYVFMVVLALPYIIILPFMEKESKK